MFVKLPFCYKSYYFKVMSYKNKQLKRPLLSVLIWSHWNHSTLVICSGGGPTFNLTWTTRFSLDSLYIGDLLWLLAGLLHRKDKGP